MERVIKPLGQLISFFFIYLLKHTSRPSQSKPIILKQYYPPPQHSEFKKKNPVKRVFHWYWDKNSIQVFHSSVKRFKVQKQNQLLMMCCLKAWHAAATCGHSKMWPPQFWKRLQDLLGLWLMRGQLQAVRLFILNQTLWLTIYLTIKHYEVFWSVESLCW